MKPLQYNAIMPRVAIENLKLLEPDLVVSLIGKDLEAIRCALTDSPYQEELSTLPKEKIDSDALEEVLLQNYVKTCKKLVKFSSGDIRKLLWAVLKKAEVSNIKTLLRAAKAQMNIDEAMKNIIPLGKLDKDRCRAILKGSKTIDDVVNFLIDLEYDLIMEAVLNEQQKHRDFALLEVALDKMVYRGILQAAEKLKGTDKRIAKIVLGIEIDATNVKIILKCKALMVSQERVRTYLMPTALIDEDTWERAITAPNTKSMIETLFSAAATKNQVYAKIFTQILKEHDAPLSRLEAILDNASLGMSLFVLKEYTRYYNIGFVLAFLNLKWVEVRNLRCIINGSERKSPASQVRKLLTFPNDL